jgi:RND family efflux transporter MFP subunit
MNGSPLKKVLAIVAVVMAAIGGYSMYNRATADAEAGTAGGGGRGRGSRLPMAVNVAPVTRADLSEQITVVGNLIGALTVDATPKINGRLQAVPVKMGDRVSRGQQLARIEDSEISQQVKQATAALDVATATVRQREADLRFANTNLERTQNLADRQLISRQTLDDAESRQQAASAQVDLAQAQLAQSQARVDELKINLANTIITSPVTGFVGKRTLDPGAWVTPNTSFISVVDISTVRLVANVVEKDLRRVTSDAMADVQVDAYPGEQFVGRVAHIAPVLDPATRTAEIEVEIANPLGRLKPGMYARVHFTVERRDKALVVPANAIVDYDGQRGVFVPGGPEGTTVRFLASKTGIEQGDVVEIAGGLNEGDHVVTTGAASLRDGDPIVISGPSADDRGARGGEQGRSGGRSGGARAPEGAGRRGTGGQTQPGG